MFHTKLYRKAKRGVMNTKYYILEGHTAVLATDLITWAKWFETGDRTVAKTKIGDSDVSTVFLGLDHNYGDGRPLLFETMIFGGKSNGFQERYSTWEEAEKGHIEVVNKLKNHEIL